MIQKKLAEIQKLWLVFERSALNPFTKSKYCPLPELWKKLWPILDEHDLLVYHTVSSACVATRVVDISDNSEVISEFPMTGTTAQLMGAAITYAKRYNLGAIFNIITDDDTDGSTPSKKKTQDADNVKNLKVYLRKIGVTTAADANKFISEFTGSGFDIAKVTESEAQKIYLELMRKDAEAKRQQ